MNKRNEDGIVWIPVLLVIVALTAVGSSLYVMKKNTTLPSPKPAKECVTAGCSGQLCVEKGKEGIITTCEYRAEYSCLSHSKCEVQKDGNCDWTRTTAYDECMKKAASASSELRLQ